MIWSTCCHWSSMEGWDEKYPVVQMRSSSLKIFPLGNISILTSILCISQGSVVKIYSYTECLRQYRHFSRNLSLQILNTFTHFFFFYFSKTYKFSFLYFYYFLNLVNFFLIFYFQFYYFMGGFYFLYNKLLLGANWMATTFIYKNKGNRNL